MVGFNGKYKINIRVKWIFGVWPHQKACECTPYGNGATNMQLTKKENGASKNGGSTSYY